MTYISLGARLLRLARIALIVYSTLVFVGVIYLTTRGLRGSGGSSVGFFQAPIESTWYIWLHLILSLVGPTIYTASMRPRTYVPRGFRMILMLIYSILWAVFPSYRIYNLRRFSPSTASFFAIWFCDEVLCKVQVVIDILSYLVAVLGLVEVYLTLRYETPYLYGKQAVTNTTIILAPVVTSATNPYQPIESYPHQQPVDGSPYYSQPGYQPVHSAPSGSSGYY